MCAKCRNVFDFRTLAFATRKYVYVQEAIVLKLCKLRCLSTVLYCNLHAAGCKQTVNSTFYVLYYNTCVLYSKIVIIGVSIGDGPG